MGIDVIILSSNLLAWVVYFKARVKVNPVTSQENRPQLDETLQKFEKMRKMCEDMLPPNRTSTSSHFHFEYEHHASKNTIDCVPSNVTNQSNKDTCAKKKNVRKQQKENSTKETQIETSIED